MLKRNLIFITRNKNTFGGKYKYIPDAPTWKHYPKTKVNPVVDLELINHLERLSLVNFSSQQAIEQLQASIKLADELKYVDTTNVKPMYNVHEDKQLYMEEDKVKLTDHVPHKVLMDLAAKSEENYYVAPPGNIPLQSKEKLFDDKNDR